jgi:hypothetical protein
MVEMNLLEEAKEAARNCRDIRKKSVLIKQTSRLRDVLGRFSLSLLARGHVGAGRSVDPRPALSQRSAGREGRSASQQRINGCHVMFSWFKNELSDRQLLLMAWRQAAATHLEIVRMALDIAKLEASAARLTAAVEALIVAKDDPAAQAAVDKVAEALDAEAVKAEAAVAPAAPVEAPAAPVDAPAA